uniref:Uncharacterized protein n=1 Tax=Arcella intermedia TaxID=1963864 RepID=A0A6B2LNP8_9EUKA
MLSKHSDVNIAHNDMTPLYISCQKGHRDIVQILLHHDADVNIQCFNGATALYAACGEGDIGIVEVLLQHKADVNIPCYNGASPLLVSCSQGHAQIVKILINHDADIQAHIYANQLTPIQMAKRRGYDDIIAILEEELAKSNH